MRTELYPSWLLCCPQIQNVVLTLVCMRETKRYTNCIRPSMLWTGYNTDQGKKRLLTSNIAISDDPLGESRMLFTLEAWKGLFSKVMSTKDSHMLKTPLMVHEVLIPYFSVKDFIAQGYIFWQYLQGSTTNADISRLHQIQHFSSVNKYISIAQTTLNHITNKMKSKWEVFFYRLIQILPKYDKINAMRKWKEDLSHSFSTAQWNKAAKVSVCIDHWDLSQTILYRYYFTPHRLDKVSLCILPLCWKNCN